MKKRIYLILSVSVILIFVAWLTLFSFVGAESNTIYANELVKSRFPVIAKNSTLEEIYRQVGTPLYIDVNSNRFGAGAYRQTRSYDTNIETVRKLMSDSNVEVRLAYTVSKSPGGHFYFYAVDMYKGSAFRILVREYLD